MSDPFVPFTEGARGPEPETPAFEPASIPDSGAPAAVVSPEKALADLADGLRLGLDGHLLDQLLHNLVGGHTGRVDSCPLP